LAGPNRFRVGDCLDEAFLIGHFARRFRRLPDWPVPGNNFAVFQSGENEIADCAGKLSGGGI
jgi:hypothetical protein